MPGSNGLPKEIRQTTQDVAQGVANAVIDRSAEKIKQLARKFLDHKLVFIEDEETIDLVKQQIMSQEWGVLQLVFLPVLRSEAEHTGGVE